MSTELNEKIWDLVDNAKYEIININTAADAIEKLILQHEIDLLNECYLKDNTNNQILQIKISELTNQLKELT